MTLIAFTEIRYMDGRRELMLRFQRADGSFFELPVTMDQLATIMAELKQPAPPPSKSKLAAPPQGFAANLRVGNPDYEEVADIESISLAAFGSQSLDEDGLL